MRTFFAALFFFLLAGAPTLSDPLGKILDVRYGQHAEKTRVVLDLSQKLPFRVFVLASPARLVIDLPEITDPEENFAQKFSPKNQGTLLQVLRFGHFAKGTRRLVFDASKPVLLDKVALLPPESGKNWRIYIDLAPASLKEFTEAPQAKRRRESESKLPESTPQKKRKTAAVGDTRKTIIIDPGHGGVDPGAASKRGVREKGITLAYAKALRDTLKKQGKYRVVLTRDTDIFLPLRERVYLAQDQKGDLFISLHANTFRSPNIKGASVYTLSETPSDAEARRLASQENDADLRAAVPGIDSQQIDAEIRQTLVKLHQRRTKNYSKTFANILMEETAKSTRLLPSPNRSAGFVVLKSPTVPSVLFEIGYLTNPEEEKALLSLSHRRKIVGAIIKAVDRYFAR